MNGLDVAAGIVAAPPLAMLGTFTAEVLGGLRRPASFVGEGGTPRTVVLIPAHDEAAGVGATIADLRAAADPAVELLVVADNCGDPTAERARLAGARVVERHDPLRRGKGYALAFGREAMADDPPACVVVLDADCAVGGQGVAALARAAVATDAAVQARNLQRPDLAAAPTAQISNFAFLIKNLVRQRGMVRLGGVAALTGTGMALPWSLFVQAPLASADLAEDLALGVWLTRTGRPPRFVEAVHIWSDAATGAALQTQRSRWERGFLATARRQALPLLLAGVAHGSRSRLWLGLHLLVPPLALLFVVAALALAVASVLALAGASALPAALLGAGVLGAGAATVAAWTREGRGQISGGALLRVPFYVAGKLLLYKKMLRRNEVPGWVRTRRAGEADQPNMTE